MKTSIFLSRNIKKKCIYIKKKCTHIYINKLHELYVQQNYSLLPVLFFALCHTLQTIIRIQSTLAVGVFILLSFIYLLPSFQIQDFCCHYTHVSYIRNNVILLNKPPSYILLGPMCTMFLQLFHQTVKSGDQSESGYNTSNQYKYKTSVLPAHRHHQIDQNQ